MNYNLLFIFMLLVSALACSGSNGTGGEEAPPSTILSITDKSQFIGGPLAQAQVGDVLMANDKVKVIIQQPSKFAQVCPFGGVIIDADIKRGDGETGQDNFGKMCPLVNIEWTVNYRDFEVTSVGGENSPVVVRATGTIDVLDYLDLDFIAPVAKTLAGQAIYYSPRFDDANNPFRVYDDLAGLNTQVVTEYRLDPGANYVKIDTIFENNGGKDVVMPVGAFVNGSGQVHLLIPNQGFSPPPTAQITGDTPAIIYVPFEGVDVSYGFFYDLRQFMSVTTDDTSAVKAQGAMITGKAQYAEKRLSSSSLSYSGVTGMFFGEEFLKVFPLGGASGQKINFSVPAGGKRTVTTYFAVGDGNAGSVFDAGLKALGIETKNISGTVVDLSGQPAAGATVVVQNETNMTVITYRTDDEGNFSGSLPRGNDDFAKAFGTGRYRLFVEKAGYHATGTNVAGTCDPKEVDVTMLNATGIKCTLGEVGTVTISGGVVDAGTGKKMPARLTIVGFDPSPDSHSGAAYATSHGAGNFEDTWMFERPWGVVDVKYINVRGEIGLGNEKSFHLEPGRYAFVFSRGVEYSMDVVEAEVPSNGAITIKDVKLKRVIGTPGWVSSDFHLHSIFSPDSGILMERRTLTAAGEGMDVLQSSDHDWVVDYAPMIDKLVSGGFIPAGSLVGLAGQEVSPNHMGHINAFPLHADTNKIDGGALDWSYSPHDTIDPSADYAMSPRDIMAAYRSGVGGTQDKILMVNHLADQPTSLLIVSSWVTSPFYEGVPLLSTYIEPSSQRLLPDEATTGMPVPFEDNGLVVADMDAVELTMSGELYTNKLRETGLPQWFNLLNMGILVTGTGDSDSHRETVDQLGLPRNFIASSVDPKDGIGTFTSFDQDAYVKAIRGHKVVVSAGPFVTVKAKGEDGKTVGVGDLVKGKNVKFFVDVKSPSWAWFDTVEVYANTEPQPADDDGVSVFKGVASDPKSFFMPYHVPKFYYEPNEIFTTSDGSLANWKEEDGVISATLEFTMDVDEDTWVVVFVSGNQGTEGFRSMFPFVTKSIADPTKMGKPPADWTLDGLIKDSHMASSAWAFANPIFIDVDGDANGDGNPFEAKYVKSGISPVKREW